MSFGDKLKGYLGKGMETTRDLMAKAGAKAQDLGEKGVLKLEIAQLQSQIQKLLSRLGSEVYASFVEKGVASISSSEPEIASIIAQIGELKKSIEEREHQLKN
jgi:peptidoglycan hydrolase CwlO-like protein